MLPTHLKDLLIREAHLVLAREDIAPILAEKEIEYKAIQKAKPGLFAAKEKKDAHKRQLAAAMGTLKILRDGVAQLDRVEPHIRRMVEDEVETHLRAHSPAYVQTLAARQHREDWDRCLERFAGKVHEFTQTLGNARNLACSGYHREHQTFSQSAVQGFILAIGAGKKVEDEIKFANKIADVQAKALKASGLVSTALPQLNLVAYSQWAAMISNMPLAEAQVEFDKLIVETKALYEEGIPLLRSQADQVAVRQGEELRGFFSKKLEEMRREARPGVDRSQTEQSVSDSERMINALGRKSVLGRLPGMAG